MPVRYFLTLISAVLLMSSCSRIDDTRIPAASVNIVFTTDGMWQRYGVATAGEYRRFIRTSTIKEPSDFPFTANTFTGYGGILLVSDMFGNPQAYDLACPYEVKPDIRVVIGNDTRDAACPVCGSTYDVFMGNGRPLSGPAADRGYGLTRYKVSDINQNLNYRFIYR